jgi:hypothetical protein
MNRKQKHVLLLLASHSTKVFDRPRLDLQALYLGTFFDNENWHVYRILEKHHPPEEVIDSADVIIMPGSNLSVNDHNPYIEQLKIAILEALAEEVNNQISWYMFRSSISYVYVWWFCKASKELHAKAVNSSSGEAQNRAASVLVSSLEPLEAKDHGIPWRLNIFHPVELQPRRFK